MKGWTFVVPTLLLGGLLVATSGQTQEKGALDGAALVKERCTTCHGAGRIDNAKKDSKGWQENVDRMIAKGAKLSKAERDTVVAYLSNR